MLRWNRTIITHAVRPTDVNREIYPNTVDDIAKDILLKICYPFANAERNMPHYRQPLLQSLPSQCDCITHGYTQQ